MADIVRKILKTNFTNVKYHQTQLNFVEILTEKLFFTAVFN